MDKSQTKSQQSHTSPTKNSSSQAFQRHEKLEMAYLLQKNQKIIPSLQKETLRTRTQKGRFRCAENSSSINL
jgi:hypothetical protein